MSIFPIPPELRGVTLFTFMYLVIAGFFALQTQNWEFIFYIAVVVVFGVFVLVLHRRVGFSKKLLWLMSTWGFLHMVGGIVPTPASWPINGTKHVFYSLWLIPNLLKYDQLVHAYGFGTATWVCWQAIRPSLARKEPTAGILLLCALGGMGLGSFNEVIEFIATLLIPNTNVGGFINTGWDLVSNMVGCTIAALLIWGIRPLQKAAL
jgi:uncharacterized membrane protein YjdF